MALDKEDLEQIKAMFSEMLPAAITPTLNRALDARLEGVVKNDELEKLRAEQREVAEKLAAERQKAEETPTDTSDITQTPDYKKAMAEIEELKRQTQSERQARQAAERQRLLDMRVSMVRDALGKSNVDPRVAKAATNHILAENLVHIKDDGSIVYRKANEFGGVDESSVESGVAAFLKTQDGKIFLPADPVRGAGPNGGDPTFRPSSDGDGQEADPEAIVLQALAGRF